MEEFNNNMVFLIDFDGTIIPKIPGIGYSNYDTGAERVLKKIVDNGHSIVLFTCRNNSKRNPYNYLNKNYKTPRKETSLEEALRWFRERNIPLSGVNTSPGQIDKVGISRKALGDIVIDDTCLGIPIKIISIDWTSYETGKTEYDVVSYCVDWSIVEQKLLELGLIKLY